MTDIKKVAVIGSGVMGSTIAAHIANSGTPVVLLDIVPEGAKDRSVLAKTAIDKLLKMDPAPLAHKRLASLITPGNLEDDINLLKDVDWIIEAVLEDLAIKHKVYERIESVKSAHAIISSNTSTIPLKLLTKDRSKNFVNHFMITHFFNPPRYMQLLELVYTPKTDQKSVERIQKFADIKLGKGVVICHDSPGFIANRIGVYWVTVALLEALKMNISVEEADTVLSRPIGVPKTGVFGLMDLIGIDLMPHIAKSLKETLSAKDAFNQIYQEPALIRRMINEGYTGRKGKGGFYRLNTEGGGKVKEVIDLQTGQYNEAKRPKVASADKAKKNWRLMLEEPDQVAQYARTVMLKTLAYTLSLVPEVAGDIVAVDEAMRLGYNWKYGPFELVDRLGDEQQTGTAWLMQALRSMGLDIPEMLAKTNGQPFYKTIADKVLYFNIGGKYEKRSSDAESWMLADKKLGNKPIAKNASASLWDIGDGIVCLEYTSKMNSVDPFVLEMIQKSVDIVKQNHKGLVIGNDSENFCVGANIGILLFAANVAAWSQIRDIIKHGQDVNMALKYAPFPVVAAPSGLALGGGCELLMHVDAIQAHIETYTGLVEVGVGIIPGWGGCKEMILRHLESDTVRQLSVVQKGGMFALSLKHALTGQGSGSLRHPIATVNAMPAIAKSFEYIGTARVSKSAEEARDMLILRDSDGITMNRQRLLPDAKRRCLLMAEHYVVPTLQEVKLPGKTAEAALNMALDGFIKNGKATPHDAVVSKRLAKVLSGGNTDITQTITEQKLLDLELDYFMELVKMPGTLDRLQHMLETGKPLRN